MKSFVVSHSAALSLLARIPNPRHGDSVTLEATESFCLDQACVPGDTEAAEIIEMLHLDIDTLDVLVSDASARRHSKHLRTHLCSKPLPPGSIVPIDYWKSSIQLFVCCPELAFVQSLSVGDDLDAIYAGYMLTADYRLDYLEPSGVVNRKDSFMDSRLTTKQRISEYLDSVPNTRHIKRAKALLKYVCEGSRSPRESALAMFFSLPLSRGGQAAGSAMLNKRIVIHEDGTSIVRYPDIMLSAQEQWSSRNAPRGREQNIRYVALDYDSDSDHKRADRFEQDALRRNELETLNDIAHFTITKAQANDFEYLVKLAKRVKRKLRIRTGYNLPSKLSETARLEAKRKIEHKQFDLWQRFVMQHKLW